MKKEITFATIIMMIVFILSCCSAASDSAETSAPVPSPAPSPSVSQTATTAPSATPSITVVPEKGSPPMPEESSINPEPLIYRDGSDVYLAVGAESIKLDDAALRQGALNAAVSPGKDTLYYLYGVDENSREGDLKRISLGDIKAVPERIAEGVYSARISADGKKILYLSDIVKEAGELNNLLERNEDAGELNICLPSGAPTIIADSVSDRCYGFSPNGRCAYFVVCDGKKSTLKLYSGKKTKAVYTTGENEYIDSIYADDSGRVLFATYSEPRYDLYLYEGGNVNLIKNGALITFVFGEANDFLYYLPHGGMTYYLRGDETLITDIFGSVRFPAITGEFGHLRFPGNVNSYDPREMPEKHFMYTEFWDNYTLYEISLPGEGIKIGKSDKKDIHGTSYRIDPGFRYVAHKYEDTLYLAKKTEGGWCDVKVCRSPSFFEFDGSGNYLYYIEGARFGDLRRISTASGETETLMKDIGKFLLWEGDCYAINKNYEVYLIKNGKDNWKLGDGVRGLYAGKGGVYAIGRDIFFLSGGKSESVASGASMVSYSAEISGSD